MTIKNFISPLRVLLGLLACSAVCLAQGDKAVNPAPAAARHGRQGNDDTGVQRSKSALSPAARGHIRSELRP